MVPFDEPVTNARTHRTHHLLKLKPQLRVKRDRMLHRVVHQDAFRDELTRGILKDLAVRRELEHMAVRRLRSPTGLHLHRDVLRPSPDDIIRFPGEKQSSGEQRCCRDVQIRVQHQTLRDPL